MARAQGARARMALAFETTDAMADAAMERLTALQMPLGEDGEPRPWFVPSMPTRRR